jgi:hypothetical protein
MTEVDKNVVITAAEAPKEKKEEPEKERRVLAEW